MSNTMIDLDDECRAFCKAMNMPFKEVCNNAIRQTYLKENSIVSSIKEKKTQLELLESQLKTYIDRPYSIDEKSFFLNMEKNSSENHLVKMHKLFKIKFDRNHLDFDKFKKIVSINAQK